MKIKINKTNGYVLTDCHANGSVSFVADIPEDAIVTEIKVCDKYLSDIIEADVVYPRSLMLDGWRVVAVVKHAEKTDLFRRVEASIVTDFEIECK